MDEKEGWDTATGWPTRSPFNPWGWDMLPMSSKVEKN
jgi:hypothetical protein